MSEKSNPQSLRPNALNLLIVLAIVFFVFGCFCRSDREFGTTPTNSTPAPTQSSNTNAESSKIQATPKTNSDEKEDKGDFIVQHGTVQNSRYKEIDQQIKGEKVLEDAANQLNKNLKLPTDIYLRTKDCGEVNALYDPNDTSITVCYELMEHFYKLFKTNGKTDRQAYDKMFDAVRFVFLHELGHAMIDLYNLPITGNEEDAADRVSAYICLEEIEGGVNSVLAMADAFAIESKNKTADKRDMADENLLQEQRFYNSLCMIYGSNTVKYDNITKQGYLPKERAVRCPSEYERTMQSWQELLKPWRKK
jgi:Putative metallopeptidase